MDPKNDTTSTEIQQSTPTEATPPQPTVESPEKEQHLLLHAFDDDLARSMDTTDATVIQQLLTNARNRESAQKEDASKRRQRGWYITGSFLLLFVALSASAYGVYHYLKLTVPLEPAISIGVFPSTEPIVIHNTTIQQLIPELTSKEFQKEKPTFVSLVSDTTTLAPLSTVELFDFIKSPIATSLQNTIQAGRYGVMNTGTENIPFILVSVANAELASKEFLIAEPTLLEHLAIPLNITTEAYTVLTGKGFQSEYAYNLPVRVLRFPHKTTGVEDTLLLYGYVTDSIIVITTDSRVLRGIYDTIILQ